MLKQTQQQKLQQKLSPQQLLFIKLLQIPASLLDSRIKEELEENPALEDNTLSDYSEDKNEYDISDDNDKSEEQYEEINNDSTDDDIHIEEYIQDDDQKEYDISQEYDKNDNDDKNRRQKNITTGSSFFEYLHFQLNTLTLTDKEYIIANQIIGTLDDDGYLRREISSIVNDILIAHGIETNTEEVFSVLKIIQSLDPDGIAARSLQECLLIQLNKKKNDRISDLAKIILKNHFDEFIKKHYDKISSSAHITKTDLKEAIDVIRKLNPKPGDSSMGNNLKSMHVIPDFHISNNNGHLVLTLNSQNAPELKISKSYKEMLLTYNEQTDKSKNSKLKETIQFVKHKLDSAKGFIDAIKQRQQTLYKTMNSILKFQYDFFHTGDERKLKPMILKDIADDISMDISTISRVANSKYVQTEYGIYSLKFFFSESIETSSGDEVSSREVKKILTDCISTENKQSPITDEVLTDLLNTKGYNIARRTVTKYREQLGIPVARLRKNV